MTTGTTNSRLVTHGNQRSSRARTCTANGLNERMSPIVTAVMRLARRFEPTTRARVRNAHPRRPGLTVASAELADGCAMRASDSERGRARQARALCIQIAHDDGAALAILLRLHLAQRVHRVDANLS